MKPDYYSFLLRIWAQNPYNNEIYWRASLQSPKSDEVISFKDLNELSKYLDKLVKGSSSEKSPPNEPNATSSEDDQT